MRPAFKKVAFGGLALFVLALVGGLLWAQSSVQAVHEAPDADGSIDVVGLDALPLGDDTDNDGVVDAGAANTGSSLGDLAHPYDSCVKVAANTDFDIDMVLDAVPDTTTPDVDGLRDDQGVLKYNNPGEPQDLALSSFSTLLQAVNPASSLLPQGPTPVATVPVDGFDVRAFGVVDIGGVGASEDNIMGTAHRLTFNSGPANGWKVITLEPLYGFLPTKMIQPTLVNFPIDNFLGGGALAEERQVTVAVGTATCAGPADIGVTKTGITVDDGVNDCDTTPECKAGEALTVTVNSTITNGGPSDADILLAASLTQTAGPSTCTIGGPVYAPAQPPTGYLVTAAAGSLAVTETYTMNCDAPSAHAVTADDTVSFSNPSATDPGNPTPDTDDIVGTFEIYQDVDVAVGPMTLTSATPPGLGCSSDDSIGGATTFTANTLDDASKAWAVDVYKGYSVTVSTASGLQTRAILSNTATALTVNPPWSALPNPGDPYAVAHVKTGFEKNIGNDMCAILDVIAMSFGSQNLNDLPTVVTGATDPLDFSATLTASSGVPPAITVGNGVGIVLAGTLDVTTGAPGGNICTVTQPTGPSTPTLSDATPVPLAYTGGDISCFESSFLDTSLNGSPNMRLQLLALVDTVDPDAVNTHINDTNPANDSARVFNLVLTSNVFALWSLPDFDASPAFGGSGNYAYQSVIDETLIDPSTNTPAGLLDPANDDVCQVWPATCSAGTYYALGDNPGPGQSWNRDDDLDGSIDEPEPYMPLAGNVIMTPNDTDGSAGPNPPDGFFVQSGVDTTFLGDPRMVDVPNGIQVGDFYATLQVDLTLDPACSAAVTIDLPSTPLYEAAVSATGTFPEPAGTNVAPVVLTDAGGSTTTSIEISAGGMATDQHKGSFVTMLTGTLTGAARVATGNDADTIFVNPMPLAPSSGDTLRVSAITRSDVFPTNLLVDKQVAGLQAKGAPIWYRYVGIAPTVPNPTPVNSVGFMMGSAIPGHGTSFAAVVITGDPELAPFVPMTSISCAPMVSESRVFGSVGPITMRSCESAATHIFANSMTRADTGGNIVIMDVSSCTSESDVSLTLALDTDVTVPSSLSGSSEAIPPDDDSDDAGTDNVPDGDSTNTPPTGPDRVVRVRTTAGAGPVPMGVEDEIILVSNDPCEARWALTSGETLVQRFSVGSAGSQLHLDRAKFATPGLAALAVDESDFEYTIECSGTGTALNAPQVSALGTALGGVPDPGPNPNFDTEYVTAILETNSDGDSLANADDNCPFTDNLNQRNADANDPVNGDDETGNACDDNDDNDAAIDSAETSGCTPGLPGPDKVKLSAAVLLTYQEDIDGVDDTDGCREVALEVNVTGTGGSVDVGVPTSLGSVTVEVINHDLIAVSAQLATTAISHSLLEGVGNDPACEVEVGGGGSITNQDIALSAIQGGDGDADLDHRSARTDLMSLASGETRTYVVTLAAECDDRGPSNLPVSVAGDVQSLVGLATVLAPVVEQTPGDNSENHPVTIDVFAKADVSVAKGAVTAPALFVPGASFAVSIPVQVSNAGPTNASGSWTAGTPSPGAAVINLTASGSDAPDICIGENTITTTPSAGPYALAVSASTINTEAITITCTGSLGQDATITVTNDVALTATDTVGDNGSYLNDQNAVNNSASRSFVVRRDADNDTVADSAPDNCPVNANPNQEDTDNDGIGDACDPLPSHNITVQNVVAPGSIGVIKSSFPVIESVFTYNYDVKNNSGHTNNEDITHGITIDAALLPTGCAVTGSSQTGGSSSPISLASATSETMAWTIKVACGGTSTPSDVGSMNITVDVAHIGSPPAETETTLLDNSVTKTISVQVY